jgi:hypothetical protein
MVRAILQEVSRNAYDGRHKGCVYLKLFYGGGGFALERTVNVNGILSKKLLAADERRYSQIKPGIPEERTCHKG